MRKVGYIYGSELKAYNRKKAIQKKSKSIFLIIAIILVLSLLGLLFF